MPYKDRDAWSAKCREYLNFLRPPGVQSERGVISKSTRENYRLWLREGGDILGRPNPLFVPLDRMRALEGQVGGPADNTVLCKCSTIRRFLRWCGNKDAFKWKICAHSRPFRGGVFLREPQVAVLHRLVHKLGPTEELVACLAVDMGLRKVDVDRLTLTNALDFLSLGCSDIRGKGRDGGKVAEQAFSEYVRGPLERYLEHRAELVRKYGQSERLILKETYYHGKTYLGPWKWRQYRGLVDLISKEVRTKVTFHDLRRTLGNRLWRRGYRIETIALVLRHENCGTTFRAYIGADLGDMRDALNGLNGTCPGTPGQ